LILPGPRQPNLASRVLGANLARLAADWQAVHAQPLLLAETFVDPERFAGTCYRASNWLEVGSSRGFGKSNARYAEHGKPKRVLVYPLVRDARALLSSPLSAQPLAVTRVKALELSEGQARQLFERLSALPELRRAQGQRHRLASVLALALCAFISGARNSRAMAQWAQQASPKLLRGLRCRWDPACQRFILPSEPTLRRLLAQWPMESLRPLLGQWLQRPGAGPVAP
jgi:DDE family transposase